MPKSSTLRFSHYTHLDSLLKIFEKGTFLFSSIGASNDFQEQALLESFEKRGKAYSPYACSFCLLKEYIPMWWIYSKSIPNENGDGKNYGMMVYFILKEGMDYADFFVEKNVKSAPVKYVPNRKFSKIIEDPSDVKKEEIGFLKSNYWKYEKEFRFVCMNPLDADGAGRIKRQINFDSIKEIQFYVEPSFHEDLRTAVRRKLEECERLKGVDFSVHKSRISNIFNSGKKAKKNKSSKKTKKQK